jgi:hypothetical protein
MGENGWNRRDFLRGSLALGVVAATGWRWGGSLAWGQLPDDLNSVEFPATGMGRLRAGRELGEGHRHDFPRIGIDAAGAPWCLWIDHTGGTESLQLTRYIAGRFAPATAVSAPGAGRVAHPVLLVNGNRQIAVWTERLATLDRWNLRARFLADGQPTSEVLPLATEGAAWRPAAARLAGGTVLVVAEERAPAGRSRLVARTLTEQGWGAAIDVRATAADALRPALAPASDGGAWLAWDETRPGGRGNAAWLLRLGADGRPAGEPRLLTPHPATHLATAVCIDKQGRPWVAWHSNAAGEDGWGIPRWIDLCCLDGDTLMVPATPQPGRNMARIGTDQSFEFPRLLTAPSGAIVVTGRPSHNFCLQTFGPDWSPLVRLPRDGWGGRGQHLEAAFDAKGTLWLVRRDLNGNILHAIEDFPTAPVTDFPLRPAATSAPAILTGCGTPARWEALDELDGIDTPLRPYYGDLHGHTWHSDGLNDIDEYYHMRRDLHGDDFASLTDHDTFVGKSLPPSSWEEMKAVTQHWHEDGRFTTLFGQEYTTGRVPRGLGHKCVYTTDPQTPLFDNNLESANTGAKLNALVRQWNGIMVPHHVGWTGSDWDVAEDDIQPLVEIVSAHGRHEFMGNLPLRHRGGVRGNFVQDALAMGRRVGIIGGSDFHGLLWHHRIAWKPDSSRTGLAGVWLPELTREALMDAFRRRRTFGTTGIKPFVDFRVNGRLMGESIPRPADERLRLAARVTTRGERIRYMTIVRNNTDWYHFGGEGLESRFTQIDDALPPGPLWYYLRVEFETGDMAWSSPVWVG